MADYENIPNMVKAVHSYETTNKPQGWSKLNDLALADVLRFCESTEGAIKKMHRFFGTKHKATEE